ncbi:MAG: TIGR03960 family B12-binding radical SAM protein [Desulfobacterales bacterium]
MEREDDCLEEVEKPSRYLGSEVNVVRKDPGRVRLRVALAFPDLYEIGTSHFGMQILYHVLNREPAIAAERVYAPAEDLEALLRERGARLCSLESRTPLEAFDWVGFSLLYELNYTNLLTMLELGGIPLLAAERDERHPLVLAGGPATCNPEPVADFFDALVVGDGEETVLELARAWLSWKEGGGGGGRGALLSRWARIEGVYIPAFYRPRWDEHGFPHLEPLRPEAPAAVRRAVLADLEPAAFPDRPIVPFGKPVHDRLRIEVARGCSRGCRFCQAGMLYRPVRERSPERLLDLAARSLAATGYEELSLLSLSTGDYGCLVPLLERLIARHGEERVAVSLPSLRAGTLSRPLMELIGSVRKTGFTIAPEAGSQRLRDAINKNVDEAEIFDTVREAFRAGWDLIKLYFMVGLPTETEADRIALVDLVRGLAALRGPGGRRGRLHVSLAVFIPKPHTPFQWAAQLSLEESRRVLRDLRERLSFRNVEVKWQNPEMSFLEGVFARGDRRLSRVLLAAYRRGCRFDGWGDRLRLERWLEAFAECGVDPGFYTSRPRQRFEPFPWDRIDIRVDRDYLWGEWEKALRGERTGDCRSGVCNACGCCDFERIRPRLQTAVASAAAPASPPPPPSRPERTPVTVQVFYSRTGPARFFGHLELVHIIHRALRRAGIPLVFSEGFHPKPRVAFDDPLPTGMESEEESFTVRLARELPPGEIVRRLNVELPEGLRAHGESRSPRPQDPCRRYRVRFPAGVPERLRQGFDPGREVSVAGRSGRLKKFTLGDMLRHLRFVGRDTVEFTLCRAGGASLRPGELLAIAFALAPADLAGARFLKLRPESA